MEWRLLTSTKGVTRRPHRPCSLKNHHPSQMNLKEHQNHLNLLIIQARKDRSLRKPMEKRLLQGQEKKVKKTSHPKKAPKSPEFIDSSKKEEELPKDDIGPPLLGVKEKAQSFFDLPKDSKNFAIEKKVERVDFIRGPYKGYKLSSIALCDTEYLKKALKRSGLGKKIKRIDKTSTGKGLTLFNFFHQPPTKSCNKNN